MIRTAARIRQEFLEFFQQRHGHTVVPSSPVVPHEDPTLLFVNAGMNQFKDVFLGRGERPFARAVNSQKVIRAGGKHNDLEDVGRDAHHHTFFEMLGNWSFGDYFKPEAIEWAWQLLTGVWGLDPQRLYATVFAGGGEENLAGDAESEALWSRFVPAGHLSRWGKKENFWEMGETGPCGPCSEIHYDGRVDVERARRPGAELVNRDHPDVVEIWNLVFIQFDRGGDGRLRPLPAQHVDTGMGLERITRFLQGAASNYATDLWDPIFRAITDRTGAAPYRDRLDDPVDVAYRVIADHVRCLTVAITDGACPGNEGRGYVLRRILRRAVRHAHQTLGVSGPLLCELVPAVVESLSGAFPELARRPEPVIEVIGEEEEQFLRTLDRGLALFAEAADAARQAGATSIAAASAFKLHDTYGFPIDLTRVMAQERGMSVDETGYEHLMAEARARSRRGGAKTGSLTLSAEAIARLRDLTVAPTQEESRADGDPIAARVAALWDGRNVVEAAGEGTSLAVILDRTNHYPEGGGQVGDSGVISAEGLDAGGGPGSAGRFAVEDTQSCGGYVLHIGRVTEGTLGVGERVTIAVDRPRRRAIMANHTGTHLLNHALREVLGEETHQRGSLVAADRLRFDFSCPSGLTRGQIERLETLVNDAIERGMEIFTDLVPLDEARRIGGLRAVFGERYPDPVRVVSIGASVAALRENPGDPAWRAHSMELCGGTHLARTDEARRLVIVHEQALASGVRRITAVTGPAAERAVRAAEDLQRRVDQAAGLTGPALVAACKDLAPLAEATALPAAVRSSLRGKLEALEETVRTARRSARSEALRGAVERARSIAARTAEAGGSILVERLEGGDRDALLPALDVIRARCPETAAMLFSADEEAERVSIAATVPPALIERGLRAGDWVREAARTCGGGGGGRPDLAQAGGKDASRIGAAMEAAHTFAEKVLS